MQNNYICYSYYLYYSCMHTNLRKHDGIKYTNQHE